MGGLTSAVHWWEESQMQVLVLGSLVVQFLLWILTLFRKHAMPGSIRSVMWLAYLGGDAIAIYALATLFNRHKHQDCGSYSTLEVVWAPILLLHLGGPDGITAYDIEDNELWTRHLLTAVSQVTVAIYVFCKSWGGGDKRLLAAAIVMFVPGVIKCFAKPWALKSASIKSLVSSSPSTQKTRQKTKKHMEVLKKYVQQRAKASVGEQKDEGEAQGQGAKTSVDNGGSGHIPPLHEKQNEGEMDTYTLKQYVEGARLFVKPKEAEAHSSSRAPAEDNGDHLPSKQRDDISSSQRQLEEMELLDLDPIKKILQDEAFKLFVDLSSPYPLRHSIFKCFWVLSEDEAYGCVRQGLASAFITLYTKLKISGILATTALEMVTVVVASSLLFLLEKKIKFGEAMYNFFRVLVTYPRVYLPWAAIGLFHKSHKEAYSGIDVKTTYAVFCCTAVLELFSLSFFNQDDKDQWPEMVAQYNLIEYFACNKNYSNIMWIASKSRCKDFLDQHWCVESCFSSGPLVKLVLEYLKDGWKEIDDSVISYHKFNDNRGQWALEKYSRSPTTSSKMKQKSVEEYEDKLGWSIKGPFDKSVLLWHIATDFCCFLTTPPPQYKAADQCRQMSNYMVYLLFVNPEMLLPGTRRHLFTTAHDQLSCILENKNLNPQSCCCGCCQQVVEEGIMETLIETMQKKSKNQDPEKGSQEKSKGGCCGCCQQVVEEGIMKTLIKTMQVKSKNQDPEKGSQEKSKEGQPSGGSEENFIDDAWVLAQGLLKLKDKFGEENMWKMIQGVWVEMLCFSASRCRGYLHAKALGSGGEFLSYVWLLLFYMGMETFTERLQREREELPSREANNKQQRRSTSF